MHVLLLPAFGRTWACLATTRRPVVSLPAWTGNNRKKHRQWQQRSPGLDHRAAQRGPQQAGTWKWSLGSWTSAWRCTRHSIPPAPGWCNHWCSPPDGHCKAGDPLSKVKRHWKFWTETYVILQQHIDSTLKPNVTNTELHYQMITSAWNKNLQHETKLYRNFTAELTKRKKSCSHVLYIYWWVLTWPYKYQRLQHLLTYKWWQGWCVHVCTQDYSVLCELTVINWTERHTSQNTLWTGSNIRQLQLVRNQISKRKD